MSERRLCTMLELETHYSLDDLHQMHLALDVIDDLAAAVAAEQKRRVDEANKR